MKIWVDDLRPAPEGWVWAKTSKHAIGLLACGCPVEALSLDHDLGGDDTSRAIVLWMCETGNWPVEVRVHSANSVGCEWLEGMIERYHPDNAYKYNR